MDVEQPALLVFDVGAPCGQGAHRPVLLPLDLGQLVVEVVLDLRSVLRAKMDGLVEAIHAVFDEVAEHCGEGVVV